MGASKQKSRFRLPEGLAPEPKRRPARVADVIRNEISSLLLYKIKDPALQSLSIVHVVMSNDLKNAKIYYTCPENVSTKDVRQGLSRAKGFIRSSLAKVMQMRYAPDLIFYSDPSAEHDARMDKLFHEIASENEPGSV
ncbi:MAG: 30S ribosome-binding factor RbfA [Desulfobulbaceae bacterium]|nr:30S ribosome-binding factor RbfA [Desulfobulbaceae bacterium]